MNTNNPKLIFLLASISQPRCLKRIQSFFDSGYEVEIFGFNRGLYNNISTVEKYRIIDLGFAPSGKQYFKKFIHSKRILKKIFKKFEHEEVVYYAFSFDIAILCKLYAKKNYIYEISDLVYTYFKNNILITLFKKIDKWIINNSILTVMTSLGFNLFLFNDTLNEKIIIQQNKVLSQLNRNIQSNCDNNNRRIIFSYIGAFRYPNTIFRFARIIGENFPQYEFHFYGESEITEMAIDLADKYENISFFGKYRNPDDLERIYNEIDVVVACYDTSTLNERYAEPNKLYESIFFKKPIVVSENTFLAERVSYFDCGFKIDASTDENIRSFLNSLNIEILNQKRNKIEAIPLTEIIDDNGKEIINFLKKNYMKINKKNN